MEFVDFAFYKINNDYLQYLYQFDKEIYFNEEYSKKTKPFLGIIVKMSEHHYFIPLTSPKEKHKKWKNIADDHFIIYEKQEIEKIHNKSIYKDLDNNHKLVLLSVLDLKKMIPSPESEYQKIEFNKLTDINYRNLLISELSFCYSIKEKIINNIEKIYNEQIKNNKIKKYYCNFKLLEEKCSEYQAKSNVKKFILSDKNKKQSEETTEENTQSQENEEER